MVTMAERIAAKAAKDKENASAKLPKPSPEPAPIKPSLSSEHKAAVTAGLVDDPKLVNAVLDTESKLPEHKKKKHLWSSVYSPEMSVHLAGGTIKANKGILRLTDSEHQELLELIASGRPDLSQNLKHLDVAAAEEIAKVHMAGQVAKPQAAQGAFGTDKAAEKGNTFLEVKPVEIPGMSEEAKAKLQASRGHMMQVTESEAHHADDSALNPETAKTE